MIVSHTGYNMFIAKCDFPWLYNAITFYYTWSMLFLFLHFYYTTYVASKRRRPTQKAASVADKETSPAGPSLDTKSPYINGYVADAHSGYDLRSRKNGSINGNAAVADSSLWTTPNVAIFPVPVTPVLSHLAFEISVVVIL